MLHQEKYQHMLEELLARSRGLGANYSLQRMEASCSILFPALSSLSMVHVAGTNGKGSVSTKIAHGFTLSGYKVGLYTSPHLRSLCERIRIDGVPLAPQMLLEAYEALTSSCLPLWDELTFFEIMTLAAFWIFKKEQIDVAVIETGLGGRLDATNVITPVLSVITSIGLDHTEQLGASIEEIAVEKAGIIKSRVPVVVGPNVPSSVVEKIAREQQALCHLVASRRASYDQENSDVARRALDLLSNHFCITDIEAAVAVRPPCRFEHVPKEYVRKVGGGSTNVLLDVAHNPQGIERLLEMYDQMYQDQPLVLLFSASKEKDVEGMLRLLQRKVSYYVFADISSSPRLFSAHTLQSIAQRVGIDLACVATATTTESAFIESAFPLSKRLNAHLLVTGSFFLMGEVRSFFGYQEFEDPLISNEISTKHAAV